MSAQTPKFPGPRIVTSPDGIDRIVPFSDAVDMSDEDVRYYQEEALKTLEFLRERVMSGQVIGLGFGTIELHDGRPEVGYGWSGGFMHFGHQAMSSVRTLGDVFSHRWREREGLSND